MEAQAEPRSLGLIKEAIGKRYGILDLLDVFVEVDRIVDITASSYLSLCKLSAVFSDAILAVNADEKMV